MAEVHNLELTRFDSVDAFEDRALPFLLEREAEHNLFIGICGQIREGRYAEAYLATVERDGRVVAAAWRTPPHNVGVSHLDDPDALEPIVRDVHDAFGTIPGVLAAKEDAARFVELWTSLTGRPGRIHIAQRIYEATSVTQPKDVAGEPRAATAADRDRLIAWQVAFSLETTEGAGGSAEDMVDRRLDEASSSGQLLWWDGDIVSMAGYGRPTPNGIGVAPVYTPPELRGRGYASACTAALTRRLLDEGRRFCVLYTDLANPTSNSIYQKIGYRPVCDVDQYRFDKASCASE